MHQIYVNEQEIPDSALGYRQAVYNQVTKNNVTKSSLSKNGR